MRLLRWSPTEACRGRADYLRTQVPVGGRAADCVRWRSEDCAIESGTEEHSFGGRPIGLRGKERAPDHQTQLVQARQDERNASEQVHVAWQ